MTKDPKPSTSPTSFSLGIGILRRHKNEPLDVLFPFLLCQNGGAEEKDLLTKVAQLMTTLPPEYLVLPSSEHAVKKQSAHTMIIRQDKIEAFFSQLLKISSLQKSAILTGLQKTITKHLHHQTIPTNSETSPHGSAENYWHGELVVSYLREPTNAPDSLIDIYHRLMLISMRKALPNSISLEGIFKKLPTIAWTNHGPVLSQDIESYRLQHALDPLPLSISHIDKFPYMINYHIPTGVRIADGSRVRLGAYLGAGSTIMPAGYVNFNAGTKGQAMVEGRISAGVLVGEESDIGGGASIMGTLSGGGQEVITIAAKCLIGANAGTGISLGFGSTIAAGTYVTAGTKVHLYTADSMPCDLSGHIVIEGKNTFKAIELSNREKILFYQDSETGKFIAKPNPRIIALNSLLHKN